VLSDDLCFVCVHVSSDDVVYGATKQPVLTVFLQSENAASDVSFIASVQLQSSRVFAHAHCFSRPDLYTFTLIAFCLASFSHALSLFCLNELTSYLYRFKTINNIFGLVLLNRSTNKTRCSHVELERTIFPSFRPQKTLTARQMGSNVNNISNSKCGTEGHNVAAVRQLTYTQSVKTHFYFLYAARE